MANKTLLTNGSKVAVIQQTYYSPVSYVQDMKMSSIFCFLSRVEPWDDDNSPPQPTEDQKSLKKIMKSMFVVKQIHSNEISPVIRRIDWTQNTVYDYYRDDVNMFEVDSNGFPLLQFYVKNKYDQVFKCLWNNNGAASIEEPYFQPGSYNTNNIFTGDDGYKWKYIYTVDISAKVTFMDATWLPVPVKTYAPNPTQTAAGTGSVDVINVIDGGFGYDPANSVISVTVTGDGLSAAGSAVVELGSIKEIIVTNVGSNYTYANVAITSATGDGATAIAPVSPIGGHGFDPLSELGCTHVMVTSTFSGAETDNSGIVMIPTDIDFHQFGLVYNPTSLSTAPNQATNSIYKTTTDLFVAGGFGFYTPDELVYQGKSLDTATFIGTVLSFDKATNIIKVINTKGSLITNAPIFGNSSKTTRTLLSYSLPDYVPLSGYIAYIENRSSIQRSEDGIEQFKIVLGY